MVAVTAADGARFEAYLHGAHVTSWRAAGDDDERLFVSTAARFEEGMAIRGGIPVCFPQFADQGALPMHGLVRTVPWTLVDAGRAADGAAHARFRVDQAPADVRELIEHELALIAELGYEAYFLTVEAIVAFARC